VTKSAAACFDTNDLSIVPKGSGPDESGLIAPIRGMKVRVKIPPGKGCGFVQFVQRHAAEMAINQMQGYPIGNSRVRLSWGRSQNNSGPAGTPYRPAPPPPQYQGMGMPPSHPYGNFAPMK